MRVLRATLLLMTSLLTVQAIAVPVAAGHDQLSLESVGPANASTFAVGDEIVVPFSVSDIGRLRGISLKYEDGIGGVRFLDVDIEDWSTPIDDFATATVTTEWPPGDYTLQRVTLEPKESSDEIDFYRDGSIGMFGGDDHTHGTHTVDLSAADFFVANDAADIDAPVLDSFEVLSRGAYGFGDTIRIAYEAHDASGISHVRFEFEDAAGRIHWVYDDVVTFSRPLTGVAEAKVGYTWATGAASLVSVTVQESYENRQEIETSYWPDGTVTSLPTGARHPETHAFDLDVELSIDNPEWDVDHPELVSLARSSDEVIFPGEKVAIDYEVSDPHFAGIHLRYWSETETGRLFLSDESGASAGVLEADADDLEMGRFEGWELRLSDLGNNTIDFFRLGYAETYQPHTQFPHDIDFTRFDFEVRPWPAIFVDANDAGRVSVAVEQGKFRVEIGENSLVKKGLRIQPLPGDRSLLTYADEDVSLTGTFDFTSHEFDAVVGAFGGVHHLSS